ncbi:MAG: hydroxyisourate hydrolase [Haliea sp.]|uniref:hydroxyisourate hydrolase n=1 Tax=Marinobacter salarius TaxID=1420917 RepID=UPI0032EDF92D
MSQITTHILDIAAGCPARDVPISLHVQELLGWREIGSGRTSEDGRISDLCAKKQILPAGTYRMHFDTAAYFESRGEAVFYPFVDVVFNIGGDGLHYHIPLLLSPYGYSTYRGS